MGRKRECPVKKTDKLPIRITVDIPARDYLQLLDNLPGRFNSISDAVRSFVREFNRKCEGEG